MGNFIDLSGKRFGSWLVIKKDENNLKKIFIGYVNAIVERFEVYQEPALEVDYLFLVGV